MSKKDVEKAFLDLIAKPPGLKGGKPVGKVPKEISLKAKALVKRAKDMGEIIDSMDDEVEDSMDDEVGDSVDFTKLLKIANAKLGKKETKEDKVVEDKVVEDKAVYTLDKLTASLGRKRYKDKLRELKAKDLSGLSDEMKNLIKEKIEKLEKKIAISKFKEPVFNENQIRHKKYREVKEAREDLSDKVKDVISKIHNQGEYKLASYQGRAGGNRKILKCPHCDGVMLAAGLKVTRTVDPNKPKTQGQREWQEYVRQVALIPEYKGIPRPKIMKAAGALRGSGYTIDQIKDLHNVPLVKPDKSQDRIELPMPE